MIPRLLPRPALAFGLAVLAFVCSSCLRAQDDFDSDTPAPKSVTITQDDRAFYLSNGIVKASVSKSNGDLFSLVYKGTEMFAKPQPGSNSGYWETTPRNCVATITIDPSKNGGERGEVSVKGAFTGNGGSAGGAQGVGFNQETRYAIGRGESGVYTYSIYSHPANLDFSNMPENRFGAKLNPEVFDWLSVDNNRNKQMASGSDWADGTQEGNMKEARYLNSGIYRGQVEHKYDYSIDQFNSPAFGWSSTSKHIGFWFINPTDEFLSGGPTKVELSCHLDDNPDGYPTILDYWRGTHYGGSVLNVNAGEDWTKVVGPIFVYVNSLATPTDSAKDNALALWQDANAQAAKESAKWPYDWVEGVDYPHKDQRATVTGQLVLNDPQAPGAKLPNLLVGLAYPDTRAGTGNSQNGRAGGVDWQNDAKHYEFWVRGDANGNFTIPKVRPGTYELHAIADGVLGEYNQQPVTVTAGQTLDLGQINWTPLRYGKQLWDVGIPNRSGSEFMGGDNYWHWGWYLHYPKLFPNDVNFTIGQSDYKKDWFFEQVPHFEGSMEGASSDSRGRSTTWKINFNLADAPSGKAVLRAAICGVGVTSIQVGVNGHPAGQLANLNYNATLNRDGIMGYWVERDLTFNASLMQEGDNTLTLTIPAGGVTSGVIYDYLRLELVPESD
jgi:rhamnogalacturonan endolyase